VGDEDSYRRTVAARSGYDWTKTNEATYVLQDEGRVVKYWSDTSIMNERAGRAWSLGRSIPRMVDRRGTMLAYQYVEGTTCYATAETDYTIMDRLVAWGERAVWLPVHIDEHDRITACTEFYVRKTRERVEQLPAHLRDQARDVLRRVPWDEVVHNADPVIFHGDFNFGNIIDTGVDFVGIDWRHDFAGQTRWGDRRYDVAKLIGGCVVHWDNARRGDFRPWTRGNELMQIFIKNHNVTHDVLVITGLSLLNSAPLHATPLDEVLVSRALDILEGLTL
jgi:hypothetical protein